MTLEELLADSPKLHRVGSIVPISYELSDRALYFINDHVNEHSFTLETGAGISTIVFAIRQTNHTCIVPEADLAARIKEYCAQCNLSLERISFLIGKSEDILPSLTKSDLDLVLIDGQHAFPTPFLDWYYTAAKLKIGGTLLIDDVQLWTGHILKQFLREEPEWSLATELSGRTAVFTKTKECSQEKWWADQPYVARKSKRLIRISELRQATEMLAEGKFADLKSKIKSRIKE